MKNYAGQIDKDEEIAAELIAAGIEISKLPDFMRNNHAEMRTIVLGTLHGWTFYRAWYYWICKGPGIDVDEAEKLHAIHGHEVRVDGHCGAPSPREHFKGFACGHYHVDSQEGLNALADTIRSIAKKSRIGINLGPCDCQGECPNGLSPYSYGELRDRGLYCRQDY